MELKLKISSDGKIRLSQLVRFTEFLFFCNPVVTAVFRTGLKLLNLASFAKEATAILIYFLLLIACVKRPQKYIKVDFILVLIALVTFFAVSLLIHPEYGEWYARADYGAWDFVFFPLNGLYYYLFIRLEDDPQVFKRIFKMAGWAMYAYFAYQIYAALQRGFWYGVVGSDGMAEMSYSISFGYHVLLYALPFLYDAVREKKTTDIIGAVIGTVMVLTNGSRGPALMIFLLFIFLLLRYFKEETRASRRVLAGFTILLLIVLLLSFYDILYALLLAVLPKLHMSSRVVTKLLEGTIASDSGRSIIWGAAEEMIRENPLGYGAMGSQHVISQIIFAGYPHSIILELMIDFGVIVGGLLLLFLLRHAAAILLAKENGWVDLFVPTFCVACGLFISLSYWSNRAFWACVGLGINYYIAVRKEKRGQIANGELQNG